jgi:hypothetical protein
MKIVGILMIIAGLSAVLYGVFPPSVHSQVPDMGLILADDTESNPARIPPILGFAGIVLGGGLIFYAKKQDKRKQHG